MNTLNTQKEVTQESKNAEYFYTNTHSRPVTDLHPRAVAPIFALVLSQIPNLG